MILCVVMKNVQDTFVHEQHMKALSQHEPISGLPIASARIKLARPIRPVEAIYLYLLPTRSRGVVYPKGTGRSLLKHTYIVLYDDEAVDPPRVHRL